MHELSKVEIISILINDDIREGDDISNLILKSIKEKKESLKENDVIVITHKIVSKSEGRTIDLTKIIPSEESKKISSRTGKDPKLVELIISQSNEIIKIQREIIITETKHGFVCANSGIDTSNVGNSNHVVLLPVDPDKSAREIRNYIRSKTKTNVAVIISDTFGRPFRKGQVNVAIGVAGINPIKSYIGDSDMYGNILRVTEIAIADEIASAAELVMGKSLRVPVTIVRGYDFSSTDASISTVTRAKKDDLFR
ncbi:MAG: coenzyme F420-0:L-glutamate ligase [Nitrososphaeraceae archaeon]|nr:coenzyme F420-0:L-glutamate ligase [Nitrososphaeraceae archaeon]MDW0177522.1 coenzyme F420-0:L-glutamate ligase [Nitrososphaeraceae archaeon]MDW0181626.1 coenzyme F420-0:L-glutamate ligase [Nitrososphaeraceae archaeon]MDW0184595.1 coenzyme F420-0:L-glutamate ligase [Nitrososphaeraceae archaeon]MDW0186375.1 coenzyme F420-0:L-glutamate ligase [Nitrososphaeraceae archaeon]